VLKLLFSWRDLEIVTVKLLHISVKMLHIIVKLIHISVKMLHISVKLLHIRLHITSFQEMSLPITLHNGA